jgi:hypothetical protein
MVSMSEHQSDLRKDLPTDVKMIETFPSYWYYELTVQGILTKRLKLGGLLGYTSTGGRMHYGDYSGEVSCDQMLKAIMLGVEFNVQVNRSERFPLHFGLKGGTISSYYDLDIALRVYDDEDTDHVAFRSTNIFIEPGFKMSAHLYKILSAHVYTGYNVNPYKGVVHLKDSKTYLLNDAKEEVKIDWSGYRVGAGIALTF